MIQALKINYWLMIAIIFMIITMPIQADDELPAGGVDILASSRLMSSSKSPEVKVEITEKNEQGDTLTHRVKIGEVPLRPWDVISQENLKADVDVGDTGIILIRARALAIDETETSVVSVGSAYLERKSGSYEKAASADFRCPAEWTTIKLPFQAKCELKAEESHLVIHWGHSAQAIELGQVRVINFGKSKNLTQMPRMKKTYEGREKDAPWRIEAANRIKQHRTAPINIEVTDAEGKKVDDAVVKVEMQRQAFGFGTAVTAGLLTEASRDGERYRQLVDNLFSRVVFENDLKMDKWELGQKEIKSTGFSWKKTQQAATWLKERNIEIRGHYLAWAPWEPWSEKLRNQPDKIKHRILEHIPKITAEIDPLVIEWDGINHLAGWAKNIDEVTGLDFYTEIMKVSRQATKLPLWVNEDQIIRPGRQQEDYYNRIKKLITDGQKPDGIANQAHFDESYLPSPNDVLGHSDRFAALVPALQITEYDLRTSGDETLEADFLRDFLTLCYSHPAYTGFILWGFWEGSHWRPECALWRRDWSEKPSATVWRDLVKRQWWTLEMGRTDQRGRWSAPGHFGLYDITVTGPQGELVKIRHTHKAGAELLKITLNK